MSKPLSCDGWKGRKEGNDSSEISPEFLMVPYSRQTGLESC